MNLTKQFSLRNPVLSTSSRGQNPKNGNGPIPTTMTYNFPLHHYSDYENIEKDSTIVKPGTVILTAKPFVYSLSPKLVDIRCDTCFKLEAKSGGCDGLILSRCGGCQQVRFCNRDCQRKGWSDGHKYECKGFSVQRRAAGSFTRLLVRIIVKLQKNSDYYDEITRRKTRRRFKDLVSHHADLKNDKGRLEQVDAMAKVAQFILSHHPDIKFPNESELLGICGRIFVNTFSITDFENHTLGTGLYIGASIFDHSCQPLAVANFESTDIIIRTIREFPVTLPILKVTICYRDVVRPTAFRKAELLKSYYFECQCERCSEFLFDNEMESVICPNKCGAEVNIKQFEECPKCSYKFDGDYIEKVAETEEATKMKIAEMGDNAYVDVAEAYIRILTTVNFSKTNWLMIEMYGVAFDGCIDMQRWDRAYQYGTMALKGYRQYLFELDPSLGLMLLKLAKLSWYLEKEKEAKTFIVEAKKILDVTHGPDSPFARQHIFPLAREISNTEKTSFAFFVKQMGWSLLRMARYVKQSKYLQQLKENEEVWSNAFPTASFLVFSKDRALITSASNPKNPFQTKINWRTYEEIQPYCQDIKGSSIVLGIHEAFDEKALFVCPVLPESVDEMQAKFEGKFADMRMAIMTLPAAEAALVGRGYTMTTWNESYNFCQNCGSSMKRTFAGCHRECTATSGCDKKQQYPPIFPVAITRVLDHSKQKTLLVRQPRHPKGMYSCIAGFMEPGETFQDCVRREIAEEAGIVVEEISYFQSQTWPLPQSSLMLGATAVAMEGSDVLDIDRGELEDAKWFTKSEVKEAYERVKKNPAIYRGNEEGIFVIPPSGAIAHHLLRNWIDETYIPSQL